MRDPIYDVSVVIPTYNRRHLLKRAVDSVAAQSFAGKVEVIIIDDASVDDTESYISKLDADVNMHYLRNEVNLGGSASRNRGIHAASGRYVALLDDDDAWLPEKLERCVTLLGTSDAQAVVTGLHRVFGDGTIQPVSITGDHVRFPRLLAMPVIGAGSSLVVDRMLLIHIGLFDESLPRFQDWDLLVRLARHTEIRVVQEPLVTKVATGLADLGSAEVGRSRFIAKHAQQIANLPAKDRRRVLANHDLHLFRLALAHRHFGRATRHALAACRRYPRFALSVWKSLPIARTGQVRLSTSNPDQNKASSPGDASR